jgi:acetyl-CoA synthetase/4-hydroxybutyrate---CoA ligase (AMP-forming)
MGIKALFQEVMDLNLMDDNEQKEAVARDFFQRLNTMQKPEYFNWASEIFDDLHVRDRGGNTALIWMDIATWRKTSFTYADFAERGNKCLNKLRQAGVKKGDNVYMMVPLIPETWFTAYACLKGGLVIVLTATSLIMREMQYRFESYPPDVILSEAGFTEMIDTAIEVTGVKPKLKLVIGDKDGWDNYNEIEKEEPTAEAERCRFDDFLFCFFTSGTAGPPKKVGHTASSYPIGHLSTDVMIGIRPDDIHHNLSAPGWAKWAWSSFFAPLNMGATATGINFKMFDGHSYLDAVQACGVTTFCAPPTAWRMFTNLDLSSHNLTTLRQSVSAGEPLNPEVINRWKRHTGTEIRDIYGQTESTAMIGNPPWMQGKMRIGSFGFPSFMYDMVLLDNRGQPITRTGQTGHIAVRLDRWRPLGLFTGYIDDPNKTASVFVDDYYYTGDRARFDEGGYWWFVGRADDVIRSSDYRIGPFDVENVLIEHPCVGEAAVVGAPDPKRYQVVKAYIILNRGYEPSWELALELFRHSTENLARFKIPRIIEFVSELPKTISGKIRRIDLKESEQSRTRNEAGPRENEFFYWDFPDLLRENNQ